MDITRSSHLLDEGIAAMADNLCRLSESSLVDLLVAFLLNLMRRLKLTDDEIRTAEWAAWAVDDALYLHDWEVEFDGSYHGFGEAHFGGWTAEAPVMRAVPDDGEPCPMVGVPALAAGVPDAGMRLSGLGGCLGGCLGGLGHRRAPGTGPPKWPPASKSLSEHRETLAHFVTVSKLVPACSLRESDGRRSARNRPSSGRSSRGRALARIGRSQVAEPETICSAR